MHTVLLNAYTAAVVNQLRRCRLGADTFTWHLQVHAWRCTELQACITDAEVMISQKHTSALTLPTGMDMAKGFIAFVVACDKKNMGIIDIVMPNPQVITASLRGPARHGRQLADV